MIVEFRYDLRLFEDIRWTRKISLFPVGFIGDSAYSSPIVVKREIPIATQSYGQSSWQNNSSQSCEVVGFSDPWFAKRKFPIDMAGFAVNVDFLASKPHQSMPYLVGYEETLFLQSLNVTLSDFEPLCECASKVYVWHTKTVKQKDMPVVKYSELKDTNLNLLVENLERNGILRIDPRDGQNIYACRHVNGCEKHSYS